MISKLLTFIVASLASTLINAQVYSYTDHNGNTIYTDNPPKGQSTRTLDITPSVSTKEKTLSEESTTSLQKTIRLSPLQPINNHRAPHSALSKDENDNPYKLTIIHPKQKETIINTNGQLVINAQITPPLQGDYKYRLSMDGSVVKDSKTPIFPLSDIERGEHQVLVEVINQDAESIAKSNSVIFYVKQTTLADKRRVNPCKFKEFGVRPECPLKDKPKPETLLRKVTNKLGLTTPTKSVSSK